MLWKVVAQFERFDQILLRRQATLLRDGSSLDQTPFCSIIMINPGSCAPLDGNIGVIGDAKMDSTMRFVVSIIEDAFAFAGKSPQGAGPVHIRNLFDVCDPMLTRALELAGNLDIDSPIFPRWGVPAGTGIVWKAWGPNVPPSLAESQRRWGQAIQAKGDEVTVVGDNLAKGLRCYHPGYLNRTPKIRQKLVEDIAAAIQELSDA